MIYSRNRRLRVNESMRGLVRECSLSVNDFVMPIFVMEGENKEEAISNYINALKLASDI